MEKFEDVKKYLEEHKEDKDVKKFYEELKKVSVEQESKIVEKWLTSPDAKRHVQAEKDKEVDKAITTWKENNLEKLVEDEILKKNPPKDPEVLQLHKKIEQMEADSKVDKQNAKQAELKGFATEFLTTNKLPVKFSEFITGLDEEKTTERMNGFKEILDTFVKETVEARFKEIGRVTPDAGKAGNGKTMKRAEFDKLSPVEKAETIKESQIID